MNMLHRAPEEPNLGAENTENFGTEKPEETLTPVDQRALEIVQAGTRRLEVSNERKPYLSATENRTFQTIRKSPSPDFKDRWKGSNSPKITSSVGQSSYRKSKEGFRKPDEGKQKTFFELCQQVENFSDQLATALKPLAPLLKKGQLWEWTTTQETSFTEARKTLSEVKDVAFYNPRPWIRP